MMLMMKCLTNFLGQIYLLDFVDTSRALNLEGIVARSSNYIISLSVC